jgi:hypothetical protein
MMPHLKVQSSHNEADSGVASQGNLENPKSGKGHQQTHVRDLKGKLIHGQTESSTAVKTASIE